MPIGRLDRPSSFGTQLVVCGARWRGCSVGSERLDVSYSGAHP